MNFSQHNTLITLNLINPLLHSNEIIPHQDVSSACRHLRPHLLGSTAECKQNRCKQLEFILYMLILLRNLLTKGKHILTYLDYDSLFQTHSKARQVTNHPCLWYFITRQPLLSPAYNCAVIPKHHEK